MHVDFAKLMEKKQVDPPTEECSGGGFPPPSFADAGHPVLHVININNTVSGVDEVMKKAMEDAKEGHKSAVREAHSMRSFVLTFSRLNKCMRWLVGLCRAAASRRIGCKMWKVIHHNCVCIE